ncbi:unnamed protein product [Ilex paraguariensis]|uniref:Uncharacterized protein n=1 Tax=Ilex paraguariensis TaxID=185542 RepID=A0ABC8SD93_9AQUA
MLGKLQEVSKYMSRLKNKQMEKGSGERADELGIERINSYRGFDEVGIDRTKSNRIAAEVGIERTKLNRRADDVGIDRTNSYGFRDHILSTEYQRPRLSADGFSRDCYEELRKAIRDGLARQNLLPNVSSQENVYFDRRKLDSLTQIPSFGSSHSSKDHSLQFTSSDSSSSKVEQEKPKGPNLIAKLMGVEEIPSKPLQSDSQKRLEGDKASNQSRLIYDVDMPKARKPHFDVQKVDQKWRTLEEIIETMQFKGLLKRNSADGLKNQTHHSIVSNLRKRLIHYAPSIVLIKPVHVPCLDAEAFHKDKSIHEEEALDSEEKLRNWKIKDEVPTRTISNQEAALNSRFTPKKKEVENNPIKRLRQEKESKDRKDVLAKPDEREVKTKEVRSYNKPKAFIPGNPKLQKKEPIEKKVDKIQKPASSARKPVEMENVTSKGVSKLHDQGKVTSTKVRRPESRSNISKIQTPQVLSSKTVTPTSPPVSRNSCNPKKRRQSASLSELMLKIEDARMTTC